MANVYDFSFDVIATDKFSAIFNELEARRERAEAGLRSFGAVMDATLGRPLDPNSMLNRLSEFTRDGKKVTANVISDSVVTNVKATGNAIATVTGDVQQSVSKTSSSVVNANRATRGWMSSLQGLTSTMWRFSMLTGVALSGFAIKDFITDSTQLAATLDGMRAGFGALSKDIGVNGPAILAEMDSMSRGTMEMEDTFQAANLAMFTGVKEFAEALPQLAMMARVAATSMGGDVGDIFERLIKGIARGSPKLIDDIGIFLKVGDAADVYAKKLGLLDASQLSTEQRIRATLEAVLAQEKVFSDVDRAIGEGPVTQLQRLTRASENVKVGFGDIFVDLGVLEGVANLLDGIADALDRLSEFGDSAEARAAKEGIGDAIGAWKEELNYAPKDPNVFLSAFRGFGYRISAIGDMLRQQLVIGEFGDDLMGSMASQMASDENMSRLWKTLFTFNYNYTEDAAKWAEARLKEINIAVARAQGRMEPALTTRPLTAGGVLVDAFSQPIQGPELIPQVNSRAAEAKLGYIARPQIIDYMIRLSIDSSARVNMRQQIQDDIISAIEGGRITSAQADALWENAIPTWTKALGGIGYETEKHNAELMAEWNDAMGYVVDANDAKNKAIEQANSDSLARQKARVEQFKSNVESALTARQTPTDADFLATKLGLYEDAPMENIRRLQAIIDNGIDEIKRRHPDWVQALQIPEEALASNDRLRLWAMKQKEMLTDMTAPLEVFKQNVNWSAFLDNLRGIEQGQTNREANIQYAVEYAVANGVFKTAAEAQAAVEKELGATKPDVGFDISLPDPAALTEKVDTAMKAIDWGGSLLSAWETSLEGQQKPFQQTGEQVANWFSEGFMSALRTNMGNARNEIARIILPAVVSALAPQQGTRSQ